MFETVNIEPILLAVFASTGFWGVVSVIIQYFMNKRSKQSEEQKKMNKMVLGLGHDRICFLGMTYVDRGYITKDEYEDLVTYLYSPYKDLGGNGTAELVINKVKQLPVTLNKETTEIAKAQVSQGEPVQIPNPMLNDYLQRRNSPMIFE